MTGQTNAIKNEKWGAIDTEIDTGAVFSDGKKIYKKVLHYNACPANKTTLITNVDTLIESGGMSYWNGNGENFNFPYNGTDRVSPVVLNHNLVIKLGGSASPSTVGASTWWFRYTKSQ